MSSTGAVVVLGAITLLMAVAATYGSFRVSRNTTAVSQYRETALAWEGRARVQETEIEDLKKSLQEKQQQISELTARVSVLQDTVTGKAQLDVLDARSLEVRRIVGELTDEVHLVHEFLVNKMGPESTHG